MSGGQQKTLPVPDQTLCRARGRSDSAIRCRESHGACTEIPGCLPVEGVGVGIHTCTVFIRIAGSLLFMLLHAIYSIIMSLLPFILFVTVIIITLYPTPTYVPGNTKKANRICQMFGKWDVIYVRYMYEQLELPSKGCQLLVKSIFPSK